MDVPLHGARGGDVSNADLRTCRRVKRGPNLRTISAECGRVDIKIHNNGFLGEGEI